MSSVKFPPRSWLTLFLIGLFAYIIIGARDLPFQARLFPWTIGFMALALLGWQLIRELRLGSAKAQSQPGENIGDWGLTAEEVSLDGRRRTLEMFAWIYGLIAGLWLFGFYMTIPAVIFFYLRRHGRGWRTSVAVPLCFWLMIWAVFDGLLHLPFPPGRLIRWFSEVARMI